MRQDRLFVGEVQYEDFEWDELPDDFEYAPPVLRPTFHLLESARCSTARQSIEAALQHFDNTATSNLSEVVSAVQQREMAILEILSEVDAFPGALELPGSILRPLWVRWWGRHAPSEGIFNPARSIRWMTQAATKVLLDCLERREL